MGTESISIGLAFVAGVLSFASPCVLPLFPSYLSFITGLSYEEVRAGADQKKLRALILVNSLFFIAGFSAVFIALGASVSYLGQVLFAYQDVVRITGGILITMFGLYIGDRALDFRLQRVILRIPAALTAAVAVAAVAGGILILSRDFPMAGGVLAALGLYGAVAVFFPAISYEKRVTVQSKPAGWAGSFIVGVAFAAGWTPCVGPILGSILLYAGTQETVGQGVVLLTSYSLGLGLPFLLSGLGVSYFFKFYQSFRRYLRGVELGSSALLLLIGLLLISDYMTIISSYLIFITGYTGV